MRGLAVALAAFLALAGLAAAAAAEQAGSGGQGGIFSWRRGRALTARAAGDRGRVLLQDGGCMPIIQ